MSNKLRRITQHKNQRDTRSSKEIQELKAENRSLRKQVSRFRRELQKVTELNACGATHTEEKEVSINACKECGGENALREFKLPGGKILSVCKDCGHRLVHIPSPV